MQKRLEHDYQRKAKARRLKRCTTLREGGQTRLYDENHVRHLKKTEALKEAALKLKKKVNEVQAHIQKSPESDLFDIININQREETS